MRIDTETKTAMVDQLAASYVNGRRSSNVASGSEKPDVTQPDVDDRDTIEPRVGDTSLDKLLASTIN